MAQGASVSSAEAANWRLCAERPIARRALAARRAYFGLRGISFVRSPGLPIIESATQESLERS
jgi:hypothetical protein